MPDDLDDALEEWMRDPKFRSAFRCAERVAAIERLREVITNEGNYPDFHLNVVHRREWPTLWEAIDDLLKVPHE